MKNQCKYWKNLLSSKEKNSSNFSPYHNVSLWMLHKALAPDHALFAHLHLRNIFLIFFLDLGAYPPMLASIFLYHVQYEILMEDDFPSLIFLDLNSSEFCNCEDFQIPRYVTHNFVYCFSRGTDEEPFEGSRRPHCVETLLIESSLKFW